MMHTNQLQTNVVGILHDRSHQSAVSLAINTHLNAVKIDEAQFDDDGVAMDRASAVETLRAEVKAFREFCHIRCQTADDVQAKLTYLLHGTVGERTTLVECLMADEYGWRDASEGMEAFLRSLQVDASSYARIAPDAQAHTHAREGRING